MTEITRVTQPENAGKSSGSQLDPIYTRREMMLYSVNETEIATISNFNDQSTLGFSIGSFFLSQAIAISITSSFAEKLTPAGDLAVLYGVPFFGLAGVAGIVWGWLAARRRGKFWNEIKNSSRKM